MSFLLLGILNSQGGGGPLEATGGTVTDIDGYRVHTFTSSGTFAITSGSGDVEYLVIAGGGATNAGPMGGGGGGNTNRNTDSVVGNGGSGGGGNAGNQRIGTVPQSGSVNTGGGGGGALNTSTPGLTGGSGGSGIVIVRYAV